MSCEHCVRVEMTDAERSDLRYHRKISGFRLKETARELGVSINTLLRWELGERRPTIDQYRRWIRVFAAPD